MKKWIAFIITLSVFVALIFASAFYIRDYIQNKPKQVNIHFLDIGQGDATLIDFPNGEQMLIDCAKTNIVLEALGRAMPFYDRTIETLVITHPDLDHYGGCIDVMKRFNIQTIVYTGAEKDNQFFTAFIDHIENEKKDGVRYVEIEQEQVWNIASTTIHFLFPDKPTDQIKFESNNTSIVVLLEYNKHTALLTADAEKELEAYLVEKYGSILDVDILKVGHHGSDTSSIQEFLGAVTPKHAIISCGLDNEYGHPTPQVMKRLEKTGALIWRTDIQGDIMATINDGLYVSEE